MKMLMTNTLLATVFACLAGCATNPIVGSAGNQAGRFTGDVGISGNGTTLTIQSGSQVPKLSIIGDACTVNVEDGATVGRIEFWGNGNTVTIPDDLNVMTAAMGTNKVVRRPPGQHAPAHGESTTKPGGQ